MISIVLYASPHRVAQAQSVELELQGVWGGAVKAIWPDPDSDLVYIGSGRRMVILNIADNPKSGEPAPAKAGVEITEVGSIDLGSTVNDIKVRDGRAYVCTAWAPNRFCIVDVSNPASPELFWSTPSGGSIHSPLMVELYGSAAYVLSGTDVVPVFLSDPDNPFYPGGSELEIFGGPFQIVGSKLYMLGGGAFPRLRVYDLGDPRAPFPVFESASDPMMSGRVVPHLSSIVVQGNHAYVTTRDDLLLGDGGLTVFDISGDGPPTVVGSVLGGFWQPQGVAVAGNHVLLADPSPEYPFETSDQGLVIYNVSIPSEPQLVGSYHTQHNAPVDVVVEGYRAYVSEYGEGLLVLDISTPDAPIALASWHSPYYLRQMDKVGDLLFITDQYNGFTILDVSDPAAPELVGVHQTGPNGMANWDIEVRNGLAYLSAGWGGIEVADVSDPANPTLAGVFPFPNPPNQDQAMSLSLDESGTIAHVGTHGALVRNYSVSDLGSIIETDSINIGGADPFIWAIDVEANSILHIARTGAVVVVDAGTSPMTLGPISTSYCSFPDVQDVDVWGNHRYTAVRCFDEGFSGLYIEDVSDLMAPTSPAGSIFGTPLTNHTSSVAVDPATGLVLFTGDIHLHVVDASDPTSPVVVDDAYVHDGTGYGTGWWGLRVLAEDGYAYVTSPESGLSIYRYLPDTPPNPADLNADGFVNGLDLGILLANWSIPPSAPGCGGASPCPADINGDGVVNGIDLGILLASWTI